MAGLRRTAMRRRPADNHLSGEEWRIVRHNLAVRSRHACECCGGSTYGLSDEAVEIQHRRAQGMGGTDLAEANNLANLLLLHTSCHRWVESRPTIVMEDDDGDDIVVDVALARGLWLTHDTDQGEPVPVEKFPLVLWSGRRVLLHPTNTLYDKHPDEWGFPGPLVVPAR